MVEIVASPSLAQWLKSTLSPCQKSNTTTAWTVVDVSKSGDSVIAWITFGFDRAFHVYHFESDVPLEFELKTKLYFVHFNNL